ncbi:MAG: methylcobamide--CoM methyltransferase [Nanoarchaeota archaeon]|nr:methylcobamide--CoM methyltransferase [Nanoarchaeota archaeon]
MITTVVGNYPKIPNYPREAKLRKAIADFEKGKITKEILSRIEDDVTIEVINEQVNAGVELITDGQIRWEDAQTYFAKKIKGFSINGLIRYFDTNTYYRQPVVENKMEWLTPICVNDFRFAVKHSPVPVKAVITGPYTLARLSKNNHYSSINDLVLDLADVLAKEANALEKAGATFIQIDEPAILKYKDDFSLLNEAVKVITRNLNVKTALYTYFGDIDDLYPDILELPVDVIGLDFVMGKNNFDIIKTTSFTKELGFGIVDARNTKIEKIDEIVNNIKRISNIVPERKLYVNPNCGLEFLPRENAYNKLVNMVKAVNKVRGII